MSKHRTELLSICVTFEPDDSPVAIPANERKTMAPNKIKAHKHANKILKNCLIFSQYLWAKVTPCLLSNECFSMNGIYLIIGGNLGNREANLRAGIDALEQWVGPVLKKSSIYETAAWGKEDEPAYLNQVLIIESSLTAQQTMQTALQIEHQLGRIRHEKWAARTLDIDLLFFNQEVINKPGLTIPHPRIAERRFVLIPLCEVAPEMIHPLLNKTMKVLLDECYDTLPVTLYLPSTL